MREIYIREPNDASYKKGVFEMSDPIEILIGQIRMLLLTKKGLVLGDPLFGIDLEGLIFDFEISEYELRSSIDNQFAIYCPLFNELEGYYEISFFQGDFRDICVIEFFIPAIEDNTPIINIKIS